MRAGSRSYPLLSRLVVARKIAVGTKASRGPLAVMVVSRDLVARHGLRSILAGVERVEASAAGPDELAAVGEPRPDVVVVDGTLSSEEVTALADTNRVVVTFAAASTDAVVLGAFACGAVAVVSLVEDTGSLAEAVIVVGGGQFYVDPALAHVLVDRAVARMRPIGPFGLTGREQRVLTMLDRSNREIGATLGIGSQTVKSHVGNILRKLEARDRRHAVEIARENGLD